MNRRDLLRSAGFVGGAAIVPLDQTAGAAPSDRIGVAIIGCGNMGRMDQRDFQKNPDVEIVAVCDVYQANLQKSLDLVGGKAKTYTDYRRVLEDRTIDAVVIATPDHWHPLICVDACNAGKDVYVEKPISHNIREGRLMVDAARRNSRVVQVGTQQRSGSHFQRAVKFVQEGKLGRIHYAQCWNHYGGGQPRGPKPPDSDPPPGLDWDLWLGPAPKAAFNPGSINGGFRGNFDYAGGQMTDWGTHLLDIVLWAMQVKAPLSCSASGGVYYRKDTSEPQDTMRQTPDTLQSVFEFKDFLLSYSTIVHNSYGHNGHDGAKPFGSYGIQFHGSLGTLFVDRAGYRITPQKISHAEPGVQYRFEDSRDDMSGVGLYYTSELTPEHADTSPQHLPHVRNFLDCIRTRNRPNADIEDGYRATAICQLGNISYRTGRKIRWNAEKEEIISDPEANCLVRRDYRVPWALKGL